MNRIYFCIDLKTFYASVECVERGLDPFKTDLIVADATRGKGAICLAISPKMKERGISNRCRVWEIPATIHPIVAKPRMRKYLEYSARIYAIYLKYIAKEDIHVYSIDEAFLDVTNYFQLYSCSPIELAQKIMQDILKTTGITATCGIGPNLYLTKIALDLIAKKEKSHLGYLDEESYQKKLWHHLPITDFWQISTGIEARLKKLHLKDMDAIAHCDEKILYQEFGKKATFLIDHAWGRESCSIAEIKKYVPKSHSISNSQVLFSDYPYQKARLVLIEMIDNLVLELVEKNFFTNQIGFEIGYSKEQIPPLKVSKKLKQDTNSYSQILKLLLEEYDYQVSEKVPIRKIGVTFSKVHLKQYEQLSFFSNQQEKQENSLEKTVLDIKKKYGKNALLRAVSYQEGATQQMRNQLLGGHHAE